MLYYLFNNVNQCQNYHYQYHQYIAGASGAALVVTEHTCIDQATGGSKWMLRSDEDWMAWKECNVF